MTKITNRFNGSVIIEEEGDLKEVVKKAINDGANLREADLHGADLRGANLREADLLEADLREADLLGADLREAYLDGANLRGANLHEADLRGANLRGANLREADLLGADLLGANLNYQSHDLLSSILLSAAGKDIEKRKVAGFILVSRELCWKDFVALKNDPLWQWAIDTIAGYVIEGDNAPDFLRERAAELKANTTRDS